MPIKTLFLANNVHLTDNCLTYIKEMKIKILRLKNKISLEKIVEYCKDNVSIKTVYMKFAVGRTYRNILCAQFPMIEFF